MHQYLVVNKIQALMAPILFSDTIRSCLLLALARKTAPPTFVKKNTSTTTQLAEKCGFPAHEGHVFVHVGYIRG